MRLVRFIGLLVGVWTSTLGQFGSPNQGSADPYGNPNPGFDNKKNVYVADSTDLEDTVKAPKQPFQWRHNPKVASLLSLALPGAGQVYNGSYWKVPIFWGILATFGYLATDNATAYRDYRDAYILLVDTSNSQYAQKYKSNWIRDYQQVYQGQSAIAGQNDEESRELAFNAIQDRRPTDILEWGDEFEANNRTRLQNRRDFHRRNRDWMYVFLGLTYLCNVLDAAVDAHFHSFDVSDNISMKLTPHIQMAFAQPTMGVGVKLSFKK